MEFGKVSADELEEIDFTLPADKPETVVLLSRQSAIVQPKIHVGCAKWGRKDWVGTIYPKGTKEADFLSHYAMHFNTIELNATFYKLPTRIQTENWKNKVGDDFRFCPKFSDKISHIKRLKDAKEYTDRFLEGISGFGDNLGPVFLMPHPTMGPKTLETIEMFLENIPKDIKLFVELRHIDWFNNREINQKIFDIFERFKVGAVITDASGRRDCVHMRLTIPTAFIRFVGNGLHPTDYTRVDDWVQRIKMWCDQGIEEVFFFMHQHDEVHSPQLCKYVIQQINKVCGLALREPVFVN